MPPVSMIDVEPTGARYTSELFTAADDAAPAAAIAPRTILNPSAALAAADVSRQRRAVEAAKFQADMQTALDVQLREQAQEQGQRREALRVAQERAANVPELPAETKIMSPPEWAHANYPQFASQKHVPKQILEMLDQGYAAYVYTAKTEQGFAAQRHAMQIDQQGAWQRRATGMEAEEGRRQEARGKRDDPPNTLEAAAVRDIIAGKKDSDVVKEFWKSKNMSGSKAARATEMLEDMLATAQMEDFQKEVQGIDRNTPEGRGQARELVTKYSNKQRGGEGKDAALISGARLSDQVYGDPALGGGVMGSFKENERNPESGPVMGFMPAWQKVKQMSPGMEPAQAEQLRQTLMVQSEGLEERVVAMVKSGDLERTQADAILAALYELRTGKKVTPLAPPTAPAKPARKWPLMGGM